MYDLTKECKTIAEIGCCRGFIANHELPEGIEQFYLCDSSEIALKHALQAAKPNGYTITPIHMDEEAPKVGFIPKLLHEQITDNIFTIDKFS